MQQDLNIVYLYNLHLLSDQVSYCFLYSFNSYWSPWNKGIDEMKPRLLSKHTSLYMQFE